MKLAALTAIVIMLAGCGTSHHQQSPPPKSQTDDGPAIERQTIHDGVTDDGPAVERVPG